MDIKFRKRVSKGHGQGCVCVGGGGGGGGGGGNAQHPSLHKSSNISETVQIPTPKPYILLFLMIRSIR